MPTCTGAQHYGPARPQRSLTAELHREWSGPATSSIARWRSSASCPRPGVAMLRIPGFGPHRQFVVVQGTGPAAAGSRPGHVPGTQLPGQVGNFRRRRAPGHRDRRPGSGRGAAAGASQPRTEAAHVQLDLSTCPEHSDRVLCWCWSPSPYWPLWLSSSRGSGAPAVSTRRLQLTAARVTQTAPDRLQGEACAVAPERCRPSLCGQHYMPVPMP